MTLAPLLDAPLAIQIHVATVVPAALLGIWMLLARKGTPLHRRLGRVWLALMVVSAASSFFIHSINMFHGFSPIHLLSAYVIYGAFAAYRSARQRRIADHRRQVIGLYFGGIVGAGAFTLLPGRIMHEVVWSSAAGAGTASQALLLAGMAIGICSLLYLIVGRGMKEGAERI